MQTSSKGQELDTLSEHDMNMNMKMRTHGNDTHTRFSRSFVILIKLPLLLRVLAQTVHIVVL